MQFFNFKLFKYTIKVLPYYILFIKSYIINTIKNAIFNVELEIKSINKQVTWVFFKLKYYISVLKFYFDAHGPEFNLNIINERARKLNKK